MIGIPTVDFIVFTLTGLGILFSVLRFLLGPSTFERLVAVDMMNVMIIGLIIIISFAFKNNMYMDIALLYGLLAFVETVVFARYLEGKVEKEVTGSAGEKSGDVK